MPPKKIRKPARPRKKRHYLDDERYAALLVLKTNDGNVNKTSQQLGIPEPTLRAWAGGFRYPEALQLYEEKSADAADAFETILWECLSIARQKAPEAQFNHLVTAAAISAEKMRLLRGESTNINTNNTTKTDATLAALAKKMTTEEREQLRALLERVMDRDQAPREITG